jgi:forkhead box protein M
MAMIQFAINSRPGRRMTLKEIYNWIEDHFPFFQQQTKPGWKVVTPPPQPFTLTIWC